MLVDDPFDSALDLVSVPLYDPGAFRLVFVDVIYDDPANSYHRDERLQLDAARDPLNLRISLMDSALRSYQYRLTFIGNDNRLQRGSFVETTKTLIGIIP